MTARRRARRRARSRPKAPAPRVPAPFAHRVPRLAPSVRGSGRTHRVGHGSDTRAGSAGAAAPAGQDAGRDAGAAALGAAAVGDAVAGSAATSDRPRSSAEPGSPAGAGVRPRPGHRAGPRGTGRSHPSRAPEAGTAADQTSGDQPRSRRSAACHRRGHPGCTTDGHPLLRRALHLRPGQGADGSPSEEQTPPTGTSQRAGGLPADAGASAAPRPPPASRPPAAEHAAGLGWGPTVPTPARRGFPRGAGPGRVRGLACPQAPESGGESPSGPARVRPPQSDPSRSGQFRTDLQRRGQPPSPQPPSPQPPSPRRSEFGPYRSGSTTGGDPTVGSRSAPRRDAAQHAAHATDAA